MHIDILALVHLNRIVSKTGGTCQFAESTNYFAFARVVRASYEGFHTSSRIVYNGRRDPRSLKFATIFVCALLVCQANDQRTLCST